MTTKGDANPAGYVIRNSAGEISTQKSALTDSGIVGPKGAGLYLLPEPWRPTYVVLSIQSLATGSRAVKGPPAYVGRLASKALELLGIKEGEKVIGPSGNRVDESGLPSGPPPPPHRVRAGSPDVLHRGVSPS